jgi:hypothetical protein
MAEPFDWMVAKRNPDVARAQRAKADALVRAELEERAALLQRLGYAKDAARERLQANARWDFEGRPGGGPVKPADIDALVERAFEDRASGDRASGDRALGGAAAPRPTVRAKPAK